MKTSWKVVSGLVALAMVLVGVVWTVPGGSIAGPGAAARSAGSAVQQAGPEDSAPVVGEVFVSEPSVPTISPAVRDLPDLVIDPSLDREMAKRDYFGFVGTGYQGPAWLDPLVEVQSRAPLAAPDAFTTPLTNWAGMDYNSYPPDTTGDVGPNHYVQAVNGSGGSTVQIYNKSGSILKTFAMDSLSSTSPCNNGYCDPIVIYDSLADRWFISEFSASSGYAMCLYVSTTPDPTGTWYAYVFDLSYYDYPKYGVWPDAYYMGYNGGPSGYRQVFAFDRAKMLAGQTATYQSFNVASLTGLSFQLLVPASWEGPAQPPSGLGGLFGRPNDTEVNGLSGYPSNDFLDLYEFDVNWTTPANSTLTALPRVPIGEFDCSLCGTGSDWSCMPQPGTTQALDPIREPLHQPLQYRNWGSYETLVGGFAEDVNGADQAAVRWFELRRAGGTWSAYQEGVVGGGDSSHRSVTSVAMDGAGGIALGYTLTSSSVYPSIRYAGRRSWDPLGTMAYVDVVAQAGTGSQASYDRWGDYSGIGIDPADDCTYWFTTEYMSGSSSATRVISFRHDADFAVDASPNAQTVTQPADAIYTVQLPKTCAFSGAVTMSASGLPSGTTAAWSTNPVTPPGSTTLTIGNTGGAAPGTYSITITGTSGGTTRSETVALTLEGGGPTSTPTTPPTVGPTPTATNTLPPTNTPTPVTPTSTPVPTNTPTPVPVQGILLVDDDANSSYEAYFTAALAALGRGYDTWTVYSQGSPSAATLQQYPVVLWFTGSDYSTTLTTTDITNLAAYLNGGGRLFITGQDIGYDINTDAFFANYLHASYIADDTNVTTLTGTDIMAGADVTITGGDGANNQSYPSAIGLGSGAVGLYDYTGTAYTWGALRWEGAYRVVYFSFGFEGISAAATRATVLGAVLTWLEGGVTPPTATPTNTPVPPTNTPTSTPVGPTNTPMPTDTPTATPVPSGDVVWLSVADTSATLGSLGTVNDEDIVVLDPATGAYSWLFDGSDVGITTDIDAFDVLDNGHILMSFDTNQSVTGVGTVQDVDVVEFTPTSLGSTTAGTFSWKFDGSDVGLSSSTEDIDALFFLADGSMVISGRNAVSVTGVSAQDEDLLRFTATSWGSTTAGTWTWYFDGSDVGLSTTTSEDVDGVWLDTAITPYPHVYLGTLGAFSVTGIAGENEDVFVFKPTALGSTTSGTFNTALYLDGSLFGLSAYDVDAFDVQR